VYKVTYRPDSLISTKPYTNMYGVHLIGDSEGLLQTKLNEVGDHI